MMSSESVAITDLIARVRSGSEGATDEVVNRLYKRFRELAQIYIRRERPDHSWSPTDLTNEAMHRLLKSDEIAKAGNTNQLFRAFARAMWQALVDHARKRPAAHRVELDDFAEYVREVSRLDVLALHEALS